MATTKDEQVISMSEEPKADSFDQYAEKEEEDVVIVPERWRGTTRDKKEMDMLGKKQVLRVCGAIRISLPTLLQVSAGASGSDRLTKHSETSDSSPCWALQVPSWRAGKSCCREYTISLTCDDCSDNEPQALFFRLDRWWNT